MTKPRTYDEADPVDSFTLADGSTVWMTGEDCPECAHPMATDGLDEWCTAGCDPEAPQK